MIQIKYKKQYAKFCIYLLNKYTKIFDAKNNIEKKYLIKIKFNFYKDIIDYFNIFFILYIFKLIIFNFFKLQTNINNLDVNLTKTEQLFFVQKIILNKNTKIIKSQQFKDCINLKYIYIPKTIKCIEGDAFLNCIRLEYVIFY